MVFLKKNCTCSGIFLYFTGGVVRIFVLWWERLHGIIPYRYWWGGTRMNGHLSRVKIHVQTSLYNT